MLSLQPLASGVFKASNIAAYRPLNDRSLELTVLDGAAFLGERADFFFITWECNFTTCDVYLRWSTVKVNAAKDGSGHVRGKLSRIWDMRILHLRNSTPLGDANFYPTTCYFFLLELRSKSLFWLNQKETKESFYLKELAWSFCRFQPSLLLFIAKEIR